MTDFPTTDVLTWKNDGSDNYGVYEGDKRIASFQRSDDNKKQGKVFFDLVWGENRYGFVNNAHSFFDFLFDNISTKMINLANNEEVCKYEKRIGKPGILTSRNDRYFLNEKGIVKTEFNVTRNQATLLRLKDLAGWSDNKCGAIEILDAKKLSMEIVWMGTYQHILKCMAKIIQI